MALPPHADLGRFEVVGRILNADDGDAPIYGSDPDAVALPDGRIALVYTSGLGEGPPRVLITIQSHSSDPLRFTQPLELIKADTWWASAGFETVSVKPPTADTPVWTMLVCAEERPPGGGEIGRIACAVAKKPTGPWEWIQNGPVMAPTYGWQLPFYNNNVALGGLDEPSHIILPGRRAIALVGTDSYREVPQVGVAFSMEPHFLRSWIMAPDPLRLSVPGALWVQQPCLVPDPRGGWHVIVTVKREGEPHSKSLWHFFTRNPWTGPWDLIPDGPILEAGSPDWMEDRIYGGSLLLSDSGPPRLFFSSRRQNSPGEPRWFGLAVAQQ